MEPRDEVDMWNLLFFFLAVKSNLENGSIVSKLSLLG